VRPAAPPPLTDANVSLTANAALTAVSVLAVGRRGCREDKRYSIDTFYRYVDPVDHAPIPGCPV
jgi:hypothetical protein